MQELNSSNFNHFVNTNKSCLVDFWAPWCSPCKAMMPLLESIQIPVGKVNVDNDNSLAVKFGVKTVPTVILFRDGMIQEIRTGLMHKSELLKLATL